MNKRLTYIAYKSIFLPETKLTEYKKTKLFMNSTMPLPVQHYSINTYPPEHCSDVSHTSPVINLRES